jgi:hypothetical protein
VNRCVVFFSPQRVKAVPLRLSHSEDRPLRLALAGAPPPHDVGRQDERSALRNNSIFPGRASARSGTDRGLTAARRGQLVPGLRPGKMVGMAADIYEPLRCFCLSSKSKGGASPSSPQRGQAPPSRPGGRPTSPRCGEEKRAFCTPQQKHFSRTRVSAIRDRRGTQRCKAGPVGPGSSPGKNDGGGRRNCRSAVRPFFSSPPRGQASPPPAAPPSRPGGRSTSS